jgi:uncharacterized protein YkwD
MGTDMMTVLGRLTGIVVALVMMVGVAVTSVLAAPGQGAAPTDGGTLVANVATADSCIDDEEFKAVGLINDYRAQNGLQPVAISQTVSAAAEHHSTSMAQNNYFSHDLTPEGISWSQNMTNHGYTYNTYRGEILAGGQTTAEQAFEGWRNSPTHNSVMLGKEFNVIGLGLVYDANSAYKWYWSADFGGYVDRPAKLCADTTGAVPADSVPADSPAAAMPNRLKIVGSSRTRNSNAATNAYDGNRGTTWRTDSKNTPNSAMVTFELSSVKTLSSIRWQFGATGGADAMEISVSNDKQTWTPVGSFTNAEADTWQIAPYVGEARYVRFSFTNPNGDKVLGRISEVAIYS